MKNEKIAKIADTILVIIFILAFISFITEMQFNKPFMSTGLFTILFAIAFFAKCYFGKN